MINPDFSDRTYTSEVIKCKRGVEEAFRKIIKLTTEPQIAVVEGDSAEQAVKVCHAFLPYRESFHRFPKRITDNEGQEIEIPRQKKIRGQEHNLYDVFIAQSGNHIVVAVPFYELAEDFFIKVDQCLGGSGTTYEKLDITAMVIKLGATSTVSGLLEAKSFEIALSVTRCHLSFVDQNQRTSNLQQITVTGANLGLSQQYRDLVAPVLNPKGSPLTVTPIVLGFALSANGVRKSSATTDRHGNFKIWIAPGLRRLTRLFKLLKALEEMKDVALTTSNIPILQSKTIQEIEG